MLEILRLVAGMVLVFLLPGAALVYALFPRKGDLDLEYDSIYRLFLSIGFSVVMTIIVGFFLNMLGLKEDGTGFFTGANIVISLSLLTVVLAVVAWYRGAFPVLGRLHDGLYRRPPPGKYEMGGGGPFIEGEESREIAELAKKRVTLNRRLTMLARRPDTPESRTEKRAIIAQLEEVVEKLEELENKRRGV